MIKSKILISSSKQCHIKKFIYIIKTLIIMFTMSLDYNVINIILMNLYIIIVQKIIVTVIS